MALVDCDETPRSSQADHDCRLSIHDIVNNIYRIIDSPSFEDLIDFSTITESSLSFLDEQAIWHAWYQSSTLPRPPGPYAWQSTSDLSEALINSAKVQINWPGGSNHPEVITRRYIPIEPDAVGFSVLMDRWIIVGVGSRLLWYDLHSRHVDEKILFDAGDGRRIECLRSAWKVFSDGRIAAFVVIFVRQEMIISEILFAAGAPVEIRPVLRTELPGTLRRYFLSTSAWDEDIPSAVDELITNVFETTTHVVKARSVLVRGRGWMSFLECFPINQHPASDVLYSSHKGRVVDILMQVPFVIHESPPDPVTGEVEFAVAGLAENALRDASGLTLSIATISLQHNGGILCERTDVIPIPQALSLHLDSSSGHVRGICSVGVDEDVKDVELVAFSLDYNPEKIRASCSETMEMDDEVLSWKLMAFDGFGGTAYFDTESEVGRCVEIHNFASETEPLDRMPAQTIVFERLHQS
ncbi:hypothetical protein BU15DRAFT_64700 [Melanogaster broomeanus]|nr:hypothetical protein BU15DRAFT_64700 [Melanogaster broomeanus]